MRKRMFDFGLRKVKYLNPNNVSVRFRWWRRRRYWRLYADDQWRPIKAPYWKNG